MSIDESHADPRRSVSMRTPLGRVRNHGSSHSGTADFWRQRVTSVAMILLIVPVVAIVLMMQGRNHAAAVQILGSPPVAIALLLFIAASVWHMNIGMQIILEDYVHDEKLKLVSIMANNFFCVVVGLASVYAIFKLASGV